MVLSKKRYDLVELIEGAGPAMYKHERQNSLVLTLWWLHVDEVNVQSCVNCC